MAKKQTSKSGKKTSASKDPFSGRSGEGRQDLADSLKSLADYKKSRSDYVKRNVVVKQDRVGKDTRQEYDVPLFAGGAGTRGMSANALRVSAEVIDAVGKRQPADYEVFGYRSSGGGGGGLSRRPARKTSNPKNNKR